MGEYWSRQSGRVGSTGEANGVGTSSSDVRVRGRRRRSRKHRHNEDEIEDISPKRRKIQTTSTYIYETLFKGSSGSDITISALGREWQLHKIYLCQSEYFSSMFSGRWKEAQLSTIKLDIIDPNITSEALDLAFSSLYRDTIHLDSSIIQSTVAAASMLQLDGLVEHCQEYMRESYCADNIITYYNTARQYGLHTAAQECLFWLKVHVLTKFTVKLLKNLDNELLIELITASDLFVMQVEMDIYSFCKKWLFLKCCPHWDDTLQKLTSSSDAYFRGKCDSQYYLNTTEGHRYREVFKCIRYQHIISDAASVTVLEGDKIVPKDWLLPLYRYQWLKMIMVEQRIEPGPSVLSADKFNEVNVRCGRVLLHEDEYCWRWTGYCFGADILLLYHDGTISVKRNCRSQPCNGSVSLQNSRQIVLRLSVVSFSEDNGVSYSQDTGLLPLTLSPDECHALLSVDNKAKFPLYISFKFSLVSSDIALT